MPHSIPLGVEVLVKKAAVDPAFRALLLERRAEAAAEIALGLQPAEAAMLAAVPRAQLEAIIDQTTVPQEHRRAFLGKAAAAMLAALGAMTPAAAAGGSFGGSGFGGARADFPQPPPLTPVEAKVRDIIAKAINRDSAQIDRGSRLKNDLALTPQQSAAIREALGEAFGVAPSAGTLMQLTTVGDVVAQMETIETVRPIVTEKLAARLKLSKDDVGPEKSLAGELKADSAQLAALRLDLSNELSVSLSWDAMRRLKTVGELIDFVALAVRRRQESTARPVPPSATRGIQPDFPPGSFGVRP